MGQFPSTTSACVFAVCFILLDDGQEEEGQMETQLSKIMIQ